MYDIGMTLKEYIQSKGLTATAFARTIGVETSTVTRWMHGELTPSTLHMRRIEKATRKRVKADDFLDDDWEAA